MRRFLVSLSLLLAATATAWAVAMPGAAAGASARFTPVPCPELAGPHLIPCCPTPPALARSSAPAQPICCGYPTECCGSTACCGTTSCCPTTTTCCPAGSTASCCAVTPCPSSGLTIGTSPDPSTSGAQLVITGVLSASPASGAQVALWRERAGQSGFQQIAQTTTGSSGAYTFTLKRGVVLADQAFYVTSGTLRSATINQHVRALVGIVSSTRSMIMGQRVVLRGHVAPSHAGQAVLIEQSHDGPWRVIALARLSTGSNYTFSHRFSQTGRTKLRAVLQGDSRNVQTISRVVTLTVTS